ncbi:MAG: aminoacyl--tRNA ligase-related protein [bacterium]|nr:aminoacyl--tRNA ligase-related protein [bacterium]
MRFSDFFVKTQRHPPADEESINAKLLAQGGFIAKLASGIYTFLPLGWLVLNKIENIVREEMNRAGGSELLMPALHPKEIWTVTGRWDSLDVLFRLKTNSGSEYALGPTHEEVLYGLLKHYVKSYKELPLSLYQIQTKFRNEPRAKSGLLRGREFRMKDLYSFHENDDDRDRYYEVIKKAYLKIFSRLGLKAILTQAPGGTFSERSHEFQVIAEAGEDTIYYCVKCNLAINKEIAAGEARCQKCGGDSAEKKAIEVGNIFPLKEKYARDFNLVFKNKSGESQIVSAGCYGLGTSRVMGAVVEVGHDEKGIIWPENIAPFEVELVALGADRGSGAQKEGERIYKKLLASGVDVLYDDRREASAGEKFKDADLIGVPLRVLISAETIKKKKLEIKKRDGPKMELISEEKLFKMLKAKK